MASFVADLRRRAFGSRSGTAGCCARLSGGVDSSVAAVMVHKAVGNQLTCIFVDHGLLRKDEGDEVEAMFRGQLDLELHPGGRGGAFSRPAWTGVAEPEQKRKIIGEEFIRVFEEEAAEDRPGGLSGAGHHLSRCHRERQRARPRSSRATTMWAACPNGRQLSGACIEPLRDLFKDEVPQRGAGAGPARRDGLAAALPRPRAGGARAWAR